MSFKIIPIADKKSIKRFIDFPHDLYKNEPNYVPELYLGQKDILNRKKNPFFQHGDMQLFLALDANEKIVGRIAGIYNGSYIKHIQEDNGFFGFFDCINNQEVANLLLTAASNWVKTKVKGKIIGPANPTSNDSWGTLIQGFDTPSMAMMPYNFAYYQTLISNAGFSKQTDLFAYIFDRYNYNDTKIKRLAGAIEERLKRKGIVIREIDLKNNFKEEVQKIKEVYNKAWNKNLGSIPMTDAEFDHMAKDLKLIVDTRFCRVAELNNKVIGISIAIPNLNEALAQMPKGRLLPTGIFKLLKFRKSFTSLRIIILGVLEEYRKFGIEACFYASLIDSVMATERIEKIEASWILEENEMMNKAIIDINGDPYKKYRVFEKMLN